uniref:Uncharacterized protein n=1 Tax=viral metagenome TaxID=1070528 RepID=A0A6H1ZVE4_9ZZZZ
MAGEGEVTLTGGKLVSGSFSAQGTAVTIWCTKLDHSMDKPLVTIPLPNQKASMDAGVSPTTLLIDLGRVSRLITIQGMLVDESTKAAQEKKNDLQTTIEKYRTVQLTWGTGSNRKQTYLGNIQKVMITETPGIIGEQATGYESEKNFAVQLAFVIGTDK